MGFGPVIGFVKAIFVGTTAGGIYAAAVNIARIGLLALSAKVFAPKVDLTEQAQSKRLTLRDPVAPQTFTYGRDLISGPLMFANVAGDENRDLYMLVGLVGHEIDAVESYRIDSEDIPLSSVSGAEDGDVNAGKFNGVARVDLRKGTSTQAAVANLTTNFPTLFNAAHTGRGWAYMVWEFNLVEGSEDVFKQQPQNIMALIRGRKLYDPRLDSTNGGTGSHRLADPSTWEWSNNPALVWSDFMRDSKFGMDEDDDRINWPDVATAADVCDETVTVPAPTNSQSRYTCNVTFTSNESRGAVIDEVLSAMLGRMVFSAGKWRVWAGEAVTPDVTLTEANLAGSVIVQAGSPSKERYNRVRGKYIDADRNYVAATYVEQRSATYESEDGGEVNPLVADFTSTQNEYEAQRKAIITLKQSRQQRVVVFEGNYSCFRLQPGLTVSLTIAELGFSGELFFISEWRLNENGVHLTLVEEINSAWADPLVGEYSTRSSTGVLTFGETGVPAPTLLTATSIPGGVQLNWTNPIETAYQYIEIWRAIENVRGSAILIGTTEGDTFFDSNQDTQRFRYYWIRAVDNLGRTSAYEPDLTTTTAIAYPETQIVPIVADPFIRQGASFWDLTDLRANYRTGEGTDSTDAIGLDTASGVNPEFYTAKRRGPEIWDQESPGRFTITINYRVALRDAGGGTWSQSPRPLVRISDDGSPENAQSYYAYQTQVKKLFTQADTLGVWFDESVTIEVDDSSGTPPRYIQVGFRNDSNLGGMEFMFDRIDAVIGNQVFVGTEGIGLVPDAFGAVGSSEFLRADGTWQVPPGGGIPTTNAETNAGVTPSDTKYPPGNVLRYGAVRDSATNDASAFQDAIDQAKEVDGDPIVVPSGDYHIATQLNIVGRDVRINGSYGSTLQWNGATSANLFKIGDGGTTLTIGTIIDGIAIEDETTGSWLIALDKADRSDFRNMYLFAATKLTANGGIENTDSTLVNWDNLRFNNLNIGIELKPLVINGTGANYVNGCRFENMNTAGIYWGPSASSLNFGVDSCTFQGQFFTGILVEWPQSQLSVERCYFEDMSWAINFNHAATQEYVAAIDNCFFADSNQDAHIQHNGSGLTLLTNGCMFRNDPLVRLNFATGKYIGTGNESVAGDPGTTEEVYKGTITNVTNANPCAVTEGAVHGYSTGDVLLLDNIVDNGPNGDLEDALNGKRFTITVTSTTAYTLNGTDTSGLTNTYSSGGQSDYVTPRQHRLRAAGDGYLVFEGTKGIRTKLFEGDQVRLPREDDVSLSSTDHPFQIGPTTGVNLRMDNGEILAANNGAASTLNMQAQGGTVQLGLGIGANHYLRNGGAYRVYGPTDTDYLDISHDDTDVNIVTVGTDNIRLAESGTRVLLPSTTDAGLASTNHPLQIGLDSGANIRIDNNEIMAVNNGAAATMDVQTNGGTFRLGFGTAANLYVSSGGNSRLYGPNNIDYVNFAHDNTDVNITHAGTVDWNISGITAIQMGAVDLDADAITATSFGGITSGNLLDKTASETVSGATWDFQDITAVSFGGIASGDLVDKSAAETITGAWIHSNASFGTFNVNRISTTGGAAIKFSNTDGVKGYAGFDDAGSFTVWDSGVTVRGRIDSAGSLFLKERASAASSVNTFGQLYVKNTTPCELWFVDDTGTETQLA